MRRRLGPIGIAIVLTATLPAGPAGAFDQGKIGTLSPDDPVIERTYPPIVGLYPNVRANAAGESAGAEPFANFKPTACRTANWCDTHMLDVTFPDTYFREVFFGIQVILSWDNPRTEDNAAGNDLDFFLWPNDDPTSGAPASKCRSPGAPECDNLHPEVITIFEPENTVDPEGTPEADQIPPLLFTVVNHTGVNAGGYTIRGEFFIFDPVFEEFVIPERGGGPSTRSRPSQTPATAPTIDTGALRGQVQGPREDRNIVLPGLDGELVEMELPVVAAGNIVPRSDEGGLNPLVIVLASVAALVIGLGLATVVRRRRLSAG